MRCCLLETKTATQLGILISLLMWLDWQPWLLNLYVARAIVPAYTNQ